MIGPKFGTVSKRLSMKQSRLSAITWMSPVGWPSSDSLSRITLSQVKTKTTTLVHSKSVKFV